MVDGLAAGLLGGHVGHRTQDLARHRQLAADGLQLRVEIRGARSRARSGFEEFGEAEIEQLDLTLVGEHHVFRLEIPVDDAVLMSVSQPVGDRCADLQPLLQGQASIGENLAQGLPFDQLHHQERVTVGLADLVYHGDVGMVEGRRCLSLALEPQPALGIGSQGSRQHLDRHLSAQLGVLGPVHLSHAALAELGGNPEVRESRADQGGEIVLHGQAGTEAGAFRRGGTWRVNGTIVFAPDFRGGLWSIPAAGGEPVELTTPDPQRKEQCHRFPVFLPDGKKLYYVNPSVELMEVDVRLDGTVEIGIPQKVFDIRHQYNNDRPFQVMPDGESFLTLQLEQEIRG